ncbi:MAG: rhodanese-related sulfurtransferase [Actinomycetota bacterium]|nr:rhodanese-related sulfurtransferase [Actinomycetota bacterium]
MNPEKVVNIAGYRFVDLDDYAELQEPLLSTCKGLGLKGTILLSPNGINFSLAGYQESIDEYINYLEKDSRFQKIPLKISYNDYQPFRRMLVRLKKEIISLGREDIRPIEFTGPNIKPQEFKKLLDNKEDIVVLDTRNDYETRVGVFENAVELDIPTFRDFPEAVSKLPEEYKEKKIVMYCTGGIRCEKASAVMLKEGFKDVQQLEGGILGYLNETDGSHWEGDCFVFDDRVAVDTMLKETDYKMCYSCREPLTEEEVNSENYKLDAYCPYCIDSYNEEELS